MTHNIKIQYPYADVIINKRKTFEVRLNDRRYNVGDTIQFRVMDGSIDMPHKLNNEEYEITYVYSGLGLEKGFVVFGIRQKGGKECVLEQIRAEIEQHNRRPSHYPCDMIGVGTVLQIIDKYKTEE